MKEKEILGTEAEYDDDACIAFIRKETADSVAINALSEDDILYVIDLIYDYMESRGFLTGEEDDEFEVDLEELYQYVTKNIKRDEMEVTLSEEDFIRIFDAEATYTESLI